MPSTSVFQRSSVRVTARDGAEAALELFVPAAGDAALLWLPALGVGIGPNVRFASALAARGIAVAVLEWRGLGSSNRRAGKQCDWRYQDVLDLDIPAALGAARKAMPGHRWTFGGHSLGGQFALIQAARAPQDCIDAVLIGSGHPYWRGFAGWRGPAVGALMHTLPLLTGLWGYFPGDRFGFAGREASGLMRDWARTGRRGNYRLAPFGNDLDLALRDYRGDVFGLRFADDWLAPAPALARLQALTPAAQWSTAVLSATDLAVPRADHFAWLRQPDAVAERVQAWFARRTGTVHARMAVAS